MGAVACSGRCWVVTVGVRVVQSARGVVVVVVYGGWWCGVLGGAEVAAIKKNPTLFRPSQLAVMRLTGRTLWAGLMNRTLSLAEGRQTLFLNWSLSSRLATLISWSRVRAYDSSFPTHLTYLPIK